MIDFLLGKVNKIRNKLISKGLYDSRLWVLILLGVISVSMFWSGTKTIQQNYELTQKVEAIKRENNILELENRNKQLQNEYYKTSEFADITARRVFGKAAPGEKVYIIPKKVALSVLGKQNTETTDRQTLKKPQYQKNLEAWVSIYFGN